MSEDVSPEMARAALEWQAQEAVVERKVEAQVAELQGGAAPAPAAQAPEAQRQAQALEANRAQLATLCGVAWTVIDRIATDLGGKHFALTADEREQLVNATVPVAEKYLPPDLSLPPEAMLAVTVGIIYGPRVMFGPQKPATAPAPEATA